MSSLHVHISRLRKTLGRETIVHHSYGYALTIGADQVDAIMFSKLADQGRQLVERRDVRAGREHLHEALGMWRGHAYEEFDDCCWARPEIVRLDAERLSALIARIDTNLEIGDTDIVGELESLILQHPRHEALCARLMLTLYRTGGQADALTVYREHAHRLVAPPDVIVWRSGAAGPAAHGGGADAQRSQSSMPSPTDGPGVDRCVPGDAGRRWSCALVAQPSTVVAISASSG